MATIEVISTDEVRIDGQNAGKIMDVIRNHSQHASDVQREFGKWEKKKEKDHTDEKQALQEKINNLQELIDSMGGTEVGKQLRKEARMKKIDEDLARLAEEKAKLETETLVRGNVVEELKVTGSTSAAQDFPVETLKSALNARRPSK